MPAVAAVVTDEAWSLPMGAASTKESLLTAHALHTRAARATALDMALLRELEGLWITVMPTLRTPERRCQAPEERIKFLNETARGASILLEGHRTAPIGGGGAGSGSPAPTPTHERTGVPAVHEEARRAEVTSPAFLDLVKELATRYDTGGSSMDSDLLELAVRGGSAGMPSTFVDQICHGTYLAENVYPELHFITAAYQAGAWPATVGRAVARTMSRNQDAVPPRLEAYTDAILYHELIVAKDLGAVDWLAADKRVRDALHGTAYAEAAAPSVDAQYASMHTLEIVLTLASATLPLAGIQLERVEGVYGFLDLLTDCKERYRMYGGTPGQDAALAKGIARDLRACLTTRGALGTAVRASKNPRAVRASEAVDGRVVTLFKLDDADLANVESAARAEDWRVQLLHAQGKPPSGSESGSENSRKRGCGRKRGRRCNK